MSLDEDAPEIDAKPIKFRCPEKEDGADLIRLVRGTGVLDVNSVYAYMLIGEHHSHTSVIAEIEGEPVGFVSAYRPHSLPETLFVWQVGVAEAGRGQGLATRMLFDILTRPICEDVRYLDTTISVSNEASKALFRRLAERIQANCEEQELFSAEMFENEQEAEHLFRIGPFDTMVIRARYL
jgi:L-2,4-diaminobutyric acid acetyltransferase